ncbi:class I SAM-dependent methyltransferase [Sutcliffiella horikoshii]|uniref:Class I SAM-dependent methyltransferase n=1 Tax=Sutcliffiella horikoshii TaxID=79883 RepID=A0A5D4T581_9BACI|nr:class I SAM-dependent methyltransferase [Sutcliffiella horikoshii]TYS70485.1 class I SAM-dependent methyltransferase [Sutcliffiella horikoshii]
MKNIEEQYKNSSNLNTRIDIHHLYSTNKEDWYIWLFDQYDISPNSNILEIGCGDGTFWYKNSDRIPRGWNITLSDFSLGMIESAKNKLRDIPNITYLQLNIEEIPFENNHFDVVIANHMLYHVQNRKNALKEVRRVLKKDGVFYCSTIGQNHMREFGQLLNTFDSTIHYSLAEDHAGEFGIENGEEQLSPYFNTVSYKNFLGDLEITDVNAIANYLVSTNAELNNILQDEELTEFLRYLNSVKEANNGAIRITKSTGLFESK